MTALVTADRRLLGAGDCKSETYLKGITYSLFGTISALNKMKRDDHGLEFSYVLSGGTAIAFHRHLPPFLRTIRRTNS